MAVLLTRPWLAAYPAAQVALAAPRYVQSLPPGEISRASILGMLPTNNVLVDMTLSGAQIIEIIEARQPLVGNLIAGQNGYHFADGIPLDPALAYHVLIPNALYEGGNYYTVKSLDPNASYTGLEWRRPIEDWIAGLKTSKTHPLGEYLRE
jgi:2',3'-cyclic-nucleotide 2'-phosphodiesterase (5'-nucleotidase family)